jgi:AsmA family protein
MKKVAIGFAAFLLFAVGGLYALTFVDVNAYREEISALAEEQTGRKLELGGPLKIGFALSPTVVARDVRFGNASWGSEPFMLEADRVAIRLSLARLIFGAVDVARLDVTGARLLLETGPDGDGNWQLAAEPADSTQAESDVSTSELPHVVLEDIRVIYKSGRRGEMTDVVLTRADVEPRGEGISIGVTGDVNSTTASMSGVLLGDVRSFSVSNLKVAYDQLALTGNLSGKRPEANSPITIDGELAADTVDLNELSGASPSTTEEAATPNTRLFSSAPLPFEILSVMNGELDISIGNLVYQDLELTDFQSALAFKDGTLTAPFFATYGERRLESQLVASNARTPQASLTLSAPGVDIGRLLKEVGATDLVEVEGHIGVDLTAKGSSPAQLAASLNGSIDIATGRGRIGANAFEWIAQDLLWALVPNGGEAGVADLTCFISDLRFDQGVGNLSSLALVTSKIRTSGAGEVNLRDETIDLRLDPRPNDPGLLSLATPVNITGPLTSPSVRPDTGALLGDLAVAVGAGVFTGGIGALLPLISAQDFDSEAAGACMEVIAASRGETKAGEDRGVLDAAGEGAGAIVEGVGDILTSPFD